MNVAIEVAGWTAAAVMLAAYALLSRGKLDGRGTRYQSLNVIGSALVGINSFIHDAWPSFSVNVVWLVIGIGTLLAGLRRHHRAQRALLDGAAPLAHSADPGTEA